MDIFYEKNLNSDSIDRHKKRAIVIRVIRILCIVLIVGVVLIVPNAIELPGEGADCGQLLLSLLISMVLFLIPPILTYVLLGRLSARQNVEYDYHILGDTFRIIKVIHRKKRKKYLEFPVSAISSLGLAESENFTRFSADKTNKKHFVFCNEDAEVLLYALVNANNGRQLLVLEGDNEFLQALRKAIKSYSALDDSLKQYLQKINREAEKAEREAAEALTAAEAQRTVQAPPAKTPATKTPATKNTTAKTSAAKNTAAKTPAAKTPAAKKPATKTPATKTPTAKKPGAKTEDDPV